VGVAVLVAVYLAFGLLGGDRVPRGTTVAGVDIGGLSVEQAEQRLEAELATAQRARVVLRADDATSRPRPRRLGLQFDPAATAEEAAGNRWNPLQLLLGGRAVEPVVVVDETTMSGVMAQIAEDADRLLAEPLIRYRGLEPRVVPGRPGRALDQSAAASVVAQRYLYREPIELPVDDLPPTVGDSEAQRALEEVAVPAVSEPIVLTAEGVAATVPPSAIADALFFEAVEGRLEPGVRGNIVHEAVAQAWSDIQTPGRDASFVIRNGKPRVVPAKRGRGVSDEDLRDAVLSVLLEAGSARAATVEVTSRDPALTTAEARGLGVRQRLSRHTEVFPYARYREINIGRAAEYLDGTLLLPGETYSMNDTVKERTEENGYTVGYIVGAGGRLEESQGGGVSTVATATWVAAFHAGLERVEQRAHTIWIPRYQAGLEATVSWGSLDLKVRNNTDNGVLITASTTPTSITVEFWGTREYSDIRAEFGPKYNVVPFSTITDGADGCVSNPGQSGFDIDVDRVFYKKGEEVERETFTTNYVPAPRVICTGAGDRIG
jgi:vancomycin resistance protein YoaR